MIIGSGPAGYTAAIYAAREDLSPVVIMGLNPGGQLELTTTVENYPGFAGGIQGPALMEVFKKQAERFGARLVSDEVVDVDFSAKPLKVKTSNGVYETHSVIIATGASSRLLGIKSEMRLMGHGVSTCGTCDAPLFRNKGVVVVGGGDTAMEDALHLTKFASKITIVHRKDAFRASKIMQQRVLSEPKIHVMWNTLVEDILGDAKVTGVKLKDTLSGKSTEMKTDGVFITIGYTPNTQFLQGKLKLDQEGYIIASDEVKTAIPGVFVAGDVSDRRYKQAVTAAGSGTKAALEVRAYLQELRSLSK